MQSYDSIIAKNTTLVLSTGSDLFKFLKGMSPDDGVVPVQPPATTDDMWAYEAKRMIGVLLDPDNRSRTLRWQDHFPSSYISTKRVA